MAALDPPLLPAPEPVLLLAAPEPAPSFWQRRAKPVTALALAVFLIVAFAIGWFLHHRRAQAAEESNAEQREELPMASVVAAERSPTLSELLLPGSLAPLTEASLYARAAGYVRRRYVDIGDTVKKGQVLAQIDSPELDAQVVQALAVTAQARQQLNQARASVGDARAKLDLAKVGWERWEVLVQANAVAKQEADQRRQEYQSAIAALTQAEANVGSAAENVRAAEANQRRLASLQDFERLRAPFDGVVTARSVDDGALISSAGASLQGNNSSTGGSGGSGSTTSGSTGGSTSSGDSSGGGASSSGPPLFRIAQIDRLRVYVNVPQGNAAAIDVGSDASVLIQEFAKPVAGRVTRTSRSLDATSRTLLTEVQVDNAQHALIPGMYAQVRFASARSNPPLLVPGEALIVRGDGVSVAVLRPVDANARQRLPETPDARCAREVHLQPVAIGRDYGTQVEITRGLSGGEFVVVDPGDAVRDQALLLPHLRTDPAAGAPGASRSNAPASGAAAGGDKKDGDKKIGDKKGDAKSDANGGAAQRDRREAQETCIEDRARQQAEQRSTAASAPTGGARAGTSTGLAPGGQSDKEPGGLQSPSMAAPTQGQKK